MGPRKERERQAMWRERLVRFTDAGLSIAEFCRREQVSEASFYQWRKRLAGSAQRARLTSGSSAAKTSRNNSGGPFRELSLPLSPPPALVEIELPSGALVRLLDGRPELLLAAIRAAAQLPPRHAALEGLSC